MRISSNWIRGCVFAASIGASLLALPAPAQAQTVCTWLWQPVCALTTFGHRWTFSNACWAKAAGARILHAGACIGGPGCTREWDPVCARGPKGVRTYGNLCTAENDNATVLFKGSCRPKKKR